MRGARAMDRRDRSLGQESVLLESLGFSILKTAVAECMRTDAVALVCTPV